MRLLNNGMRCKLAKFRQAVNSHYAQKTRCFVIKFFCSPAEEYQLNSHCVALLYRSNIIQQEKHKRQQAEQVLGRLMAEFG